MAGERRVKKIGQRAGTFDGRIMLGRRFEDETGTRSWHVTTWPVEGYQIDDYWIEGDRFFEMIGWYISGFPGQPDQLVTGRLIVEIEEKKKDTLLKGIAQWEIEAPEISERQ